MLTENPMFDENTRKKVGNSLKKLWENNYEEMYQKYINDNRNQKISLSKRGEKNPNYKKTGCWNHINTQKFYCEYCGIVTTKGNIRRWHGNNCKHRTII